ncbi:hypothetical protein, variant [Aphanomyces invadans]|uniref:histone acetyltransferase n=1 Tax=Aphanomyces invadans TaxID=157072 RepID=A0A024UPE2_9STRA|nr:hypothetical protein, variant [Aphanomyces invadans]ETW08045.1 hypothetical protein, variant [Aphanomyces invadans]|eukprot:XP_008864138.1 hypothetical protein, variant [Aphanomyces invadans]
MNTQLINTGLQPPPNLIVNPTPTSEATVSTSTPNAATAIPPAATTTVPPTTSANPTAIATATTTIASATPTATPVPTTAIAPPADLGNAKESSEGAAKTNGSNDEWRNKENDRSARQHIARIILSLIMKSANRPASNSYNPREIARRLEHTLYMNSSSKEEYSNLTTLKVRLQHALDTSRRRQQEAQLKQAQGTSSSDTTATAVAATTTTTTTAGPMKAPPGVSASAAAPAALPSAGLKAPPASATAAQAAQLKAAHTQAMQTQMQLQQAQFQAQMQMLNKVQPPQPGAVSTPASGTGSNPAAPAPSSNILEELEREADEMAGSISDQPLEMPASELENTTVATTANANMINMPINMLNMGMMQNRGVPYGMNLLNGNAPYVHPQLQLQQLQQMQMQQLQLQKLQQMQQLHHMQLNAAAKINQVNNTASTTAATTHLAQPPATTTAGPTSAASAVPSTVPGGGVALSMPPGLAGEVTPKQRREEFRKRLIQLKHARTCQSNPCEEPFCAKVKVLLTHVSNCSDAECNTIGCKSTRQLLSHYRKCRDMQCYVCSAIRTQNPTGQAFVLRRQQDRLCMLRHASTCAAPLCPMAYCVDMKVLWKHICECRQSQCTVDHCISSRYVLSHFKQCQKPDCGVCVPVRHAIKIIDSTKTNPQELQQLASSCPNDVKVLIRQMTTVPISLPMQQGGTGALGMMAPQPQSIGDMKPPQSIHLMGQPLTQAATAPSGVKQEQPLGPPSNLMAAGGATVPPTKVPAKPKAKTKAAAVGTTGVLAGTPVQATGKTIKTEGKAKKNDANPQPNVAGAPNAIKKPPASDKEKKEIRKLKAEKAKERQQSKLGNNGVKPVQSQIPNNGSTIKMEPEFKIPTVMPASSPTNVLNNEQDFSYLDSMTEAQLDEHIKSLRFNFCGHISMVELKNRLMPLLTAVMETEHGWAFNTPVDPIQWNIPDYLEVIKCPMDLGTIKKRLESEHYVSVESFASDVRLTFENCIAYNSSTNKFNQAAKQLLVQFETALLALKEQLESELKSRCEQRREEMCQLCGGDSFKFAPCMLFCSGPCTGRIRRHTHYYSDPRGEYHWCSSCYKQMKDGPLDMSLLPVSSSPATNDPPLTKAMLLKKKNSEVAEEPWVACDTCKLWYHQICGLFNERNHAISGEQELFVCPFCTIKTRQSGQIPQTKFPLQAKRLPVTRMAARIEKRVVDALAKAQGEELARLNSLGNLESDGSSALHPKTATPPPSFAVTIREVLSVDKQVQIKPRMSKLFVAKEFIKPGDGTSQGVKRTKNNGDASVKKVKVEGADAKATVSTAVVKREKKDKFDLTYRSRCICVFQELDGVDVLIFTLYVQEYGDTCAEPNRGRVYVSYLDSVAYFQPKKFRVLMHQQVILGFLEDAKIRGYHTAHIWSCPPLKGDDYIFFCKPENQKIPKAARLRSWYSKLLQGAKKEGLVYNISNLYAEYYMKRKTALELPYFEGDYWPRLAEDLIKQVEEKAKPSTSSKSSHRKSSSDGDPNAAIGAAAVPTQADTVDPLAVVSVSGKHSSKNKGEVNLDPIMQKLKAILEPQKEDFFVVDLHPRCHKCNASVINRPYWTLKTLVPTPDPVNDVIEALKKAKTAAVKTSMLPRHYQHYYCASCYDSSKNNIQSRVEASVVGAKKAQDIYAAIQAANSDPSTFNYAGHDVLDVKYELSLTSSVSSLLLEGESSRADLALEPDTDELMPCEIFDTREAFLMYCQNNHCQFDQIRRSKHSSMMVLYHLFNQGTTGFTFSCHKCNMTLTSGKRWNCSICINFNLCEGCRAKTKHEHPLHPFQIVSIPQPKHKTSAEIDQHNNMDGSNLLLDSASSSRKKNAKKRPGPKKGKGKGAGGGGGATKKAKPDMSSAVDEGAATTAAIAQVPMPSPRATTTITPVAKSPAGPATIASSQTNGANDAATASGAVAAPSSAAVVAAPSATSLSGSSNSSAAAAGAASAQHQQQRIHNVDPQLLVQLEHASLCKLSDACTYTNCNRMRAMLKHGATCEARKVGPCQLCKRIVGLLSAHAKQCTKPINECQVPRCTEIRRLVEQQQQKQAAAAAAATASSGCQVQPPPVQQ